MTATAAAGDPRSARPLPAIDEVIRRGGNRILASKLVRAEDPYLIGHYPGMPIYPGVFMVETVHQAVAWLVLDTRGPRHDVRLSELVSLRLRGLLVPGDVLSADIACVAEEPARLRATAALTSAGRPIADLVALFAVGEEEADHA